MTTVMMHPFLIFPTLEIKCRVGNTPIIFNYNGHYFFTLQNTIHDYLYSTFTALPNNPHARVFTITNIVGTNPSTIPNKHVSEVNPTMKRNKLK